MNDPLDEAAAIIGALLMETDMNRSEFHAARRRALEWLRARDAESVAATKVAERGHRG